jgi:uncharacterized membrane protein YidH (DUF202 family)
MRKKVHKKSELHSPAVFDVSSYGWAIYFTGGMLSFSSYKGLALIISAIGLFVIVMAAATYPKEQGKLLRIKNYSRLSLFLLLSFLACIFLRLMGFAVLILGSSLFLYGCFSLKHQATYLNGSIFNSYGTRYGRETTPFIYWGATLLFLLLGALLLLGTLWAGQWFQT